jgi:hypothetical protein
MKVTNKQIAKVFRDAIAHLAMSNEECCTETKHRWICVAIFNAAPTEKISDAAVNIISNRIENHAFVTGWLRLQAGIDRDLLTTENVQAYRKRWLESLAAEFERK